VPRQSLGISKSWATVTTIENLKLDVLAVRYENIPVLHQVFDYRYNSKARPEGNVCACVRALRAGCDQKPFDPS
jgi:hypothetical protein